VVSITPMLAVTGPLPIGPGWVYEFKWDGVRAIAVLRDGAVRLFARSGAEITTAYPDLVHAAAAPVDAVLDGEVVLMDESGHPSFTLLAERMHVRERGRAARLAAALPVTYMVFDVLELDGRDLRRLPYAQRREILERLPMPGPRWLVPPQFADGPATLAAARENALEGVVAKRLDAPYREGARTGEWVKIKLDRTGEFVVGGWRPGARRLGAMLVGMPVPGGGLAFRGRVGGGISGASERALLAQLEPLRTDRSPFADPLPREDAKDAVWVRPELVVELRYGNRTPDGRLRFPRFLRLRPDKTAEECVDE
jgi:bifunctional non-homologous end joining protein LigD